MNLHKLIEGELFTHYLIVTTSALSTFNISLVQILSFLI